MWNFRTECTDKQNYNIFLLYVYLFDQINKFLYDKIDVTMLYGSIFYYVAEYIARELVIAQPFFSHCGHKVILSNSFIRLRVVIVLL